MMRTLIFGINLLALILLLLAFLVPLVTPQQLPVLSLLSLLTLPLIGINAVFAIYWLIRWNIRFFLSSAVIILAHIYFGPFVLGPKDDPVKTDKTVKVLSHNVHLFDKYGTTSHGGMVEEYARLIEEYVPDVLCLQEYTEDHEIDFTEYPHQYVHYNPPFKLMGQAILSRFPILQSGSLNFSHTANNVIYADVLIQKDTVRVYNVHLQSLGINPTEKITDQGGAQQLSDRISTTFIRQQKQAEELLQHAALDTSNKIIAGDFNNTAFSYIYKCLSEPYNDAFQFQGHGLGATYHFNGLPLRIDFIFTQPEFTILDFETIQGSQSDHLPVIVSLKL